MKYQMSTIKTAKEHCQSSIKLPRFLKCFLWEQLDIIMYLWFNFDFVICLVFRTWRSATGIFTHPIYCNLSARCPRIIYPGGTRKYRTCTYDRDLNHHMECALSLRWMMLSFIPNDFISCQPQHFLMVRQLNYFDNDIS